MKPDTSSSASSPVSPLPQVRTVPAIPPLRAARRNPPTPSSSGTHACLQNASSSSTGPPPAPSTALPSSTTTTYTDDARAGSRKSRSSQRRSTLPFSFPFFQLSSNTLGTSLVSSTAEGKAIPLDGNTAAHRTSALRELNSNFPSPVARHRCTKSSGAQSSTYSQPVIVRTYTGPTGSRGHSRSNSNSTRRPGPASATSTSISYISPVAHSRPTGPRQNGGMVNMVRGKPNNKVPWPWKQGQEQERATDQLPPPEAFSFKTIMANMQAQSNEVDKALDGIAEIYARSRYSLSNQYEVHVAPHGSGASIISSVPSLSMRRRGHARNSHSQSGSQNGPTLQAIQSDDDDNSASARAQRRRRNTGRRRSVAHSTLETIMSSSRSSEEDKTRKKSAAELVEQTRGRATSKSSRSGSGSPSADAKDKPSQQGEEVLRNPIRKRSKSFANAIINADTSKNQAIGDSTSPQNPSAALLSEPSLPQTSSSHLEIRTTPNDLFGDASTQGSRADSPGGSDQTVTQFLQGLAPREAAKASGAGLISGLGNWVPWKGTLSTSTAPGSSEAAGSLRELLKTLDAKDKGKSVEQPE